MSAPILVGGEALYDLVADGDGAVTGHPGGGPFNTARTIGRLGQPVAFVGRLSTDRLGATHERLLAADAVDLGAVVRTADPTTLAVASLDAGGAASYAFHAHGTAAAGLTVAAALAALPQRVAALHVGTLGLVLEPLASALEAVARRLAGATLVMLDPNCRPSAVDDEAAYRARVRRMLALSDVVKVSDEDLAWLDRGRPRPQAARALLALGPRIVLLTRGSRGATVLGAGGEIAIAPVPAQVVDTIGAGDAFSGGFLAYWSSHGLGRGDLADGERVAAAAQFASAVAARTVAQAGATPPRLRPGAAGRPLSIASL